MYKIISIFFLLWLCCIGKDTMAQKTKRICDTIPYEYLLEKIIIPIEVNGVKVKYILDTGGRTGTMWEDAVAMGVESAGSSVQVSDLNGEKSMYQKGILPKVKLSPNYTLNHLETMVLPEIGMFKDLGVAGILGGDAFLESVLTFDSQKQVVIINYPYRPLGLKIQDGEEMFLDMTYHSVVNVDVQGIKRKMLFDTGAHGFFLISTEDFLEFEKLGLCYKTDMGFGINGSGLSGLSKPVQLMKGVVPELTFLGKKFTNVGSITNPYSQSIIGVDILKYGKVVIDYMRKRFYFLPFDNLVEDMGGAVKTWNVGVLPANGHFEVVRIWDSLKGKVELGDEVIDINGKNIKGLPLSQKLVEEIFDKIEGNEAFIIVKQGNVEKKIRIMKE